MKPRPGLVLLLALLPAFTLARAVQAQTSGLGTAPGSHLHMLLEKTLFKVDVLTLDLCVDADAGARISALLARARSRALDDSIARAVLAAHEAIGRIRFLRDIDYGTFLDGVIEEQHKAVEAGWLADSTHRAVRAALPDWYSFLENRNIEVGDQLIYRFRADTVKTQYLTPAGEVTMERQQTGEERRASVLTTWLAPGSSFRGGLLQSLRRPTSSSDASTRACAPSD
jgi:hypothetical protein